MTNSSPNLSQKVVYMVQWQSLTTLFGQFDMTDQRRSTGSVGRYGSEQQTTETRRQVDSDKNDIKHTLKSLSLRYCSYYQNLFCNYNNINLKLDIIQPNKGLKNLNCKQQEVAKVDSLHLKLIVSAFHKKRLNTRESCW